MNSEPRHRACPLDLHRLLPMPARLLRLGPEAAETRAWLWAHWGTTQALRGVVELPVPRPGQPRHREPGLFWLGFVGRLDAMAGHPGAPRALAGAAARGPAALR